MDLTTGQLLPYPSSDREAGNVPIATELLARAVDSKLATIDAAWAAARYPSTQILRLNVPISGITANNTYVINVDTVDRSVGCAFDASPNNISVDYPCGYGWYLIQVYLIYNVSGTVNGGSRRRLTVSVEQNVPGSSPTVVEQFIHEDYQSNGTESSNAVTFVTQLVKGRVIWLYFDHTNTSSTLTVTSGMFAATQITPVV